MGLTLISHHLTMNAPSAHHWKEALKKTRAAPPSAVSARFYRAHTCIHSQPFVRARGERKNNRGKCAHRPALPSPLRSPHDRSAQWNDVSSCSPEVTPSHRPRTPSFRDIVACLRLHSQSTAKRKDSFVRAGGAKAKGEESSSFCPFKKKGKQRHTHAHTHTRARENKHRLRALTPRPGTGSASPVPDKPQKQTKRNSTSHMNDDAKRKANDTHSCTTVPSGHLPPSSSLRLLFAVLHTCSNSADCDNRKKHRPQYALRRVCAVVDDVLAGIPLRHHVPRIAHLTHIGHAAHTRNAVQRIASRGFEAAGTVLESEADDAHLALVGVAGLTSRAVLHTA